MEYFRVLSSIKSILWHNFEYSRVLKVFYEIISSTFEYQEIFKEYLQVLSNPENVLLKIYKYYKYWKMIARTKNRLLFVIFGKDIRGNIWSVTKKKVTKIYGGIGD